MKFKWTKTEQYDFEGIKQILARDNLLAYPGFNKEFNIHIDASNFQIGSVISHNGKQIALYSIKLTKSQKMYTVT